MVEQWEIMVKPAHLLMLYTDRYKTTLNHFCLFVNPTITSVWFSVVIPLMGQSHSKNQENHGAV